MTPKEKAKELVNKYKPFVYGFIGSSMLTNTEDQSVIKMNAKQCALIAVDEIINYLTTSLDVQTSLIAVDYWREVKQEIEKL